jgi:manganese/zinc/iron transport system permease protein
MLVLFAQLEWFAVFASPVAQRIILVGAVTNVACALVGCFLVLRRMSLMGDAISHAVLPGLVLAFVASGSLDIVPLFIGAAVVGLLTTFLVQTLHQYGGVPTDASMGVVFTSLFALGVVLLKTYVSQIHFDVDCVFEGLLYQAGFDTFEFAGFEVPRQLRTVFPVMIINMIVIAFLWKEFKLSSFDSALATSMGFSATLLHYLLMMMVAVTTVASFEVVGSILVVAMLIVPPATAQLLTNRLAPMLLLACVFAVLSSVIGYWLASEHVWNVDPSGAMVVAAGGMYALAVLFAPQYGILSTLIRNLQTSLRILREDLLLMLYRLEEIDATKRLRPDEAMTAVGGGPLARWALAMLRHRGRVNVSGGQLQMTDDGRWRAARLVRGHRLWESYLAKHLGLPLDHLHASADRVEHFIHEPLRDELQREFGDTQQDPHGRDIPG